MKVFIFAGHFNSDKYGMYSALILRVLVPFLLVYCPSSTCQYVGGGM